MMRPRRWLASAAMALVAVGCDHPQETLRTSNAHYDVELLFVHEGARVYRFSDNGHWHYYADARGVIVGSRGETRTTIDADGQQHQETVTVAEEIPTAR